MLHLKAMLLQIDLSSTIHPLPLCVLLFLQLKDLREGSLLDMRRGIVFSIEVLCLVSIQEQGQAKRDGRGGIQSLLKAGHSPPELGKSHGGYQHIAIRHRVVRRYLVERGLLVTTVRSLYDKSSQV